MYEGKYVSYNNVAIIYSTRTTVSSTTTVLYTYGSVGLSFVLLRKYESILFVYVYVYKYVVRVRLV